MTTTTATPGTFAFEVETTTGVHTVTVDTTADFDPLTPAEYLLYVSYIGKCGIEDPDKAAAGACLFILLTRAVAAAELDVAPHDLLRAVI